MEQLKFTTAECKNTLPDVLILYLWQLAAESGAEEQTFVLTARHTGAGEVQEILHRRNKYSSWHRVFGYAAVDAVVQVRLNELGSIMSLQDDPSQTRQEVAACTA